MYGVTGLELAVLLITAAAIAGIYLLFKDIIRSISLRKAILSLSIGLYLLLGFTIVAPHYSVVPVATITYTTNHTIVTTVNDTTTTMVVNATEASPIYIENAAVSAYFPFVLGLALVFVLVAFYFFVEDLAGWLGHAR